MSVDIPIRLTNVTKRYYLYHSPMQMALDLLGFYDRFHIARKFQSFLALNDLNLTIRRGERVGIIGRNGAGKTTLLKLITKNFAPTHGEVAVSGQVQTLMDAGLGFHPEFTGLENIRASLIYNGLSKKEVQSATEEIIEFVELGEFIKQPLKTYSLGMATRLAFATATSIKPEILIIDEVLGAGDAYFAAKSAERMKRLTKSGTTLMLVSHSTAQILQYCERVIWMDKGQVRLDGEAMSVIKQYDSHMRDLESNRIKKNQEQASSKFRNKLQTAPGGVEVSRWSGSGELIISAFRTLDESGSESFVFGADEKIRFEITLTAARSGNFDCQHHIYVYRLDGTHVSMHLSESENFDLQEGEERKVSLVYERNLLGNGEHILTVGLYKKLDLRDPESKEIYDLIDRSFKFKVYSRFDRDESIVRHPGEWVSGGKRLVDLNVSQQESK